MKKLLRKLILRIIIICILIIIGKQINRSSLSFKSNSQSVQEQPTVTGIDLSNCVSYFDGCNNCSVKDGKPDACTLMYCETPSQPKCLQYATGAESNTGTTGLANPASVNCEEKGGTLEIVTDLSGGQSGMCHLSGGVVCEERAFMRGECPK